VTTSPDAPVGYRHLYVHVPFCARRCSYCDFSIAIRTQVPWQVFADAVARELRVRKAAQSCEALSTLYLGGGTPSRLGAEGVERLFEQLHQHIRLEAHAEVTLEANPEDVSPAAVAAWRRAGVNRVSLGVQSFDNRVLAWMHRVHDADAAIRAVDVDEDRLVVRVVAADLARRQLEFDLQDGVPGRSADAGGGKGRPTGRKGKVSLPSRSPRP
jgi:oxygen-independent coproporphyrinogen-3 oxidase